MVSFNCIPLQSRQHSYSRSHWHVVLIETDTQLDKSCCDKIEYEKLFAPQVSHVRIMSSGLGVESLVAR